MKVDVVVGAVGILILAHAAHLTISCEYSDEGSLPRALFLSHGLATWILRLWLFFGPVTAVDCELRFLAIVEWMARGLAGRTRTILVARVSSRQVENFALLSFGRQEAQ